MRRHRAPSSTSCDRLPHEGPEGRQAHAIAAKRAAFYRATRTRLSLAFVEARRDPGGAGENRPVRVLFTFAGGTGHFLPLLPFAQAATDAGHEVAVGGQEKLLPLIEQNGYEAFDT